MEDFCAAPLPITFDPLWTDELLVKATIWSLAVSIVLALVALWNAFTAQRIASKAEAARAKELELSRQERLDSAKENQAFELALRMDDALSDFFLSAHKYSNAASAWVEHAKKLDDLTGGIDPDSPLLGQAPEKDAVLASIENVLLRARADYDAFILLHGAVQSVMTRAPYEISSKLLELVEATRRYRLGDYSLSEFTDRLRYIEPKLDRLSKHLR